MTRTPQYDPDAVRTVMDVSYGLWRSQTLYAGVELGVFDAVDGPTPAAEVADELALDPELSYRLLRALASLGLLAEDDDRRFAVTSAGELLRTDHPASLCDVVRIINGPDFLAPWQHLTDYVREGDRNPFVREHGRSLFERTSDEPAFGATFNDGMNGLTRLQTPSILGIFEECGLSEVSHLCDVAGGRGYMLSHLLRAHPHLEGTVLDLPSVEGLVAPEMGVGDRCEFVGGDMFESVPSADAYTLKHVLHDWSDEECSQILSTIHESAPADARLFVIEPIVPGPEASHFSKLFDVYLMSVLPGRLRTATEHADLLADAGWEHVETWHSEGDLVSAVEAVKA